MNMDTYTDLKDKIAIVTGGARGIGLASAKKLALHGATVVLADIRLETAEQSAEALRNESLDVLAYELNVLEQKSIQDMVDMAISKYGRIDILVNNAGIADSTDMLELTVEDWDNLLNINLRGAHLCTQACLKYMIPERSGKIVFMSSRAGEMGSDKVAPSYCASKGGMLALCKSYAIYCAPHNINCNAIAPGFIMTDMTKGRDDPNSVPIKRLGTPEDVANSVYFLASELSSYITGNIVDINGGLYIR